MALTPVSFTVGVVHHDDVGAGVERQLGGRGAHSGGAADDEHALAVESEGIEERHVDLPFRFASSVDPAAGAWGPRALRGAAGPSRRRIT